MGLSCTTTKSAPFSLLEYTRLTMSMPQLEIVKLCFIGMQDLSKIAFYQEYILPSSHQQNYPEIYN